MSSPPTDQKPQTEFEYTWYFAKAIFWAALAAAFIMAILLDSGLDRLIVGFLAGCAFCFVMAFFHHGNKKRHRRGFINWR